MIRKNYISYLFKTILSLVFITGFVYLTKAQTVPSYHKPYKSAVVAKNNTNINYRNNSNAQTSSTPAYCPTSPVTFKAYDATTNSHVGSATSISLTCSSDPIYIHADNTSQIVTPCIESEFTSSDALLPNNGTEQGFEGGTNTFCLAASGCIYSIGGGGGFGPLFAKFLGTLRYL